jgi:hypothetical protein
MLIAYLLRACFFSLETTFLCRRQFFRGFRRVGRNSFGGATGGITATLLAGGAPTGLARLDVYPLLVKPARETRLGFSRHDDDSLFYTIAPTALFIFTH